MERVLDPLTLIKVTTYVGQKRNVNRYYLQRWHFVI